MNENKGVFGIWDEGEDMPKGSLALFVSLGTSRLRKADEVSKLIHCES